MNKLTKNVPLYGLVLALLGLIFAGVMTSEKVLALPQSGHAFYGSVTTLEGGSVPYDPEAPTDPTRTTMVYARDVTRVLNFDGLDDYSSGEYYGRPVTVDDLGATRFGYSPQAFIFPAYDPADPSVQGAQEGDEIEFYICAPGGALPGVLVTTGAGEPLRATFVIGGRTPDFDLSADILFTISGNAGVADAVLKDGAGAVLAEANAAGEYSFEVSYGWSGVVTPELEGYEFDPASISYTHVTADQSDQDYTATATVEAYYFYLPLFIND